jgi:anti-anti-sigma factor
MSNSNTFFSPLFDVRVDRGIAVLRVFGKAYLHSHATEYARILAKLREQGVARFILDLSSCDYISSEGISNVTRSWKSFCDEGKGRMAVVVPNDPANEVRNLFDVIGISPILGNALQPTVEAAVNCLLEPTQEKGQA